MKRYNTPKMMLLMTFVMTLLSSAVHGSVEFKTKSGLGAWIDPTTPMDRRVYTSSRGEKWELVMSDEFNTVGRSFKPGDDHLWTSIEKPDGVNAALEIYSHNMTSTACDEDGTCYFYIKVIDEVTTFRLWNDYQDPPGFKNVDFYYRAAMVQSWNKFCFQGGMVEVRAQLPGAIEKKSGNPDLRKPKSAQASSKAYYPTWPGIWMMGNLGRAIFSASTNRMWPFSYNECDENVFASKNQRISACNSNPGHGLNPNQGRGAPEIDILEGDGSDVSSSIQLGPGMPDDFRIMGTTNGESAGCIYSSSCESIGANHPDVPTAYYEKKRGHKSWYQGLLYAANNFCTLEKPAPQDYKTIKASLDAGISENTCNAANCPGSKDPNAAIKPLDDGSGYWGINSNGTCYPVMNGYTGAYLCSPGNPVKQCGEQTLPPSNKIPAFNYQMDAISSNWPIQVGAYIDYLVYQLEWVTGDKGYVRWMLAGHPLFEIPAKAIINPPQDRNNSNPKKIMLEEPMYMIFNVALSSTWGAKPPHTDQPCRGDGSNEQFNAICDSFPMYLKIDYIRLYQDLSENSKMQVGCNPKSHPTRQWILDHIEEYQDDDNPVIEVFGMGFCTKDDDCTLQSVGKTNVKTGSCIQGRCKCRGKAWGGPRCTHSMSDIVGTSDKDGSGSGSFGPSFFAAFAVCGTSMLLSLSTLYYSHQSDKQVFTDKSKDTSKRSMSAEWERELLSKDRELPVPKDQYSTNFV